jgi:hypothetical protein
MTRKARVLAQHGGQPDGLEGSDPAGCDFDGPHHPVWG